MRSLIALSLPRRRAWQLAQAAIFLLAPHPVTSKLTRSLADLLARLCAHAQVRPARCLPRPAAFLLSLCGRLLQECTQAIKHKLPSEPKASWMGQPGVVALFF
ncbi:unnamed protein product [Rangifer tarandus platyrhynchus]|uniref:Uncharacterized protein n=1 Tax=Rangifer tarandus platyrhynchus TaxID=3082113 RepID=A0AC59YJR8_RANTA